jgi:hypothetical protein
MLLLVYSHISLILSRDDRHFGLQTKIPKIMLVWGPPYLHIKENFFLKEKNPSHSAKRIYDDQVQKEKLYLTNQ